jgi:hypothetical protein
MPASKRGGALTAAWTMVGLEKWLNEHGNTHRQLSLVFHLGTPTTMTD